MNRLPLDGIVVADFSRVLAGPLCTQLMADAGARVIKVEEPLRGDETRRWGPPFVDGVSAYFLAINRNKESIALDLRTDRGRAIARALIARADVIVDNFLPSQREALGLTFAATRAIRADIIHCSISGFDADSPDAAAPGYDLLAQAGSGLMSITGEAEGEPVKAGVAVSDILTAHYAYGAINAALFARERSGEGAAIEVSLFGATVASLINVAQNVIVTGAEASRHGNEHASIVPYQLFHGSDRPFVIGAGTDRHFEALCASVLDEPELARDARYAANAARVENRRTLIPLLEGRFKQRAAEEWVERCRSASVPASLVRGVREALGESLLVEGGMVRNPVRFDGERFPIRSAPPALGAGTERIVRELFGDRDPEQNE